LFGKKAQQQQEEVETATTINTIWRLNHYNGWNKFGLRLKIVN